MSTITRSEPPQPARDHCLAPSRDAETIGEGRYGRLFGDLPALTEGEQVFRRQGARPSPATPPRSWTPRTTATGRAARRRAGLSSPSSPRTT
jgi:hypothetical protein